MKKISEETKVALFRVIDDNVNLHRSSEMFQVPVRTVCCIYRKKQEEGNVKNKPRGGNFRQKLSDDHLKFIKGLIEENCTITLRSIQNQLLTKRNKVVCTATIHNNVVKMSVTKKRIIKVGLHLFNS